MEKVRIAQIGIGHDHAACIFNSLKKQKDIFDIVGYALPNNEDVKFKDKCSCFDGYKKMTVEEIMADKTITAVTVETEEVSLTKYAQLSADNGKHIHMDKPGSPCLADFEKLIETVKSKNLTFHIGYMYRYNPYVMDIMEKVKNGDLGEIYSVEAQMNCKHPVDKRNWLGTFKGGMLFFLGCHLIDLILQIQGVPENVIPLSRSTGIDGVTGEDFGMAVFEYKNGVSFAKSCAEEKGGFARRQLVVCGSKGTIELKPFEFYRSQESTLQYTGRTEYYEDNWRDAGIKSETAEIDRYDDMMAAFAKMSAGEKKNPWDYDYELLLYKTVLRACGV